MPIILDADNIKRIPTVNIKRIPTVNIKRIPLLLTHNIIIDNKKRIPSATGLVNNSMPMGLKTRR